MIHDDPILKIRELIPQDELLALLAEESSELSHAALKLRRVYEGTNPTPVRRQAAYEAVLEEIADLSNVLVVLGYDRPTTLLQIQQTMNRKLERWLQRLENRPVEEESAP